MIVGMIERWHIRDIHESRVLEVCLTPRKARAAQRRWFELFVDGGGPETAIRRVVVKGAS